MKQVEIRSRKRWVGVSFHDRVSSIRSFRLDPSPVVLVYPSPYGLRTKGNSLPRTYTKDNPLRTYRHDTLRPLSPLTFGTHPNPTFMTNNGSFVFLVKYSDPITKVFETLDSD